MHCIKRWWLSGPSSTRRSTSISMVLAKALPDVAEYYEELLVDPSLHSLGKELRERYETAKRSILELTNRTDLLEHNPTLQRSIVLRNPYVDRLMSCKQSYFAD